MRNKTVLFKYPGPTYRRPRLRHVKGNPFRLSHKAVFIASMLFETKTRQWVSARTDLHTPYASSARCVSTGQGGVTTRETDHAFEHSCNHLKVLPFTIKSSIPENCFTSTSAANLDARSNNHSLCDNKTSTPYVCLLMLYNILIREPNKDRYTVYKTQKWDRGFARQIWIYKLHS